MESFETGFDNVFLGVLNEKNKGVFFPTGMSMYQLFWKLVDFTYL